jgi:hypothetical protein
VRLRQRPTAAQSSARRGPCPPTAAVFLCAPPPPLLLPAHPREKRRGPSRATVAAGSRASRAAALGLPRLLARSGAALPPCPALHLNNSQPCASAGRGSSQMRRSARAKLRPPFPAPVPGGVPPVRGEPLLRALARALANAAISSSPLPRSAPGGGRSSRPTLSRGRYPRPQTRGLAGWARGFLPDKSPPTYHPHYPRRLRAAF